MLKKTFATVVVAGAIIALTPMAAHADTYLDEVTQALQTSTLYVSPVTGELNTDDQISLTANIGNSDIAIAVLPASARSEISDIPSFVQEVASRTGYDTVLVSIGGDFVAGSSALPSGVASRLADQAEGNGTAAGLNEFVDAVQAQVPASAPNPGTPQDAFDIGVVVWPVGIILAIAAATTAGVMVFRRRQRSPKTAALDKGVPSEIRERLDRISEFAQQISGGSIAQDLLIARTDVGELFKRARKRQPDKIQQITAQYKGTLDSVLQVAERIVDIEEHPRYYKSYDRLLSQGAHATRQYGEGVVQNIQQIESGSLTDFIVDTKILEATRREEDPSPFREDRS
jgi:hypothetical protein